MAWENANTYAPWQTPNGLTGQNQSFASYGQTDSGPNWLGMPTSEGSTRGDVMSMDFGESLKGALGFWDFKGGKKRSSPNFYAPSYQGQMFTPQEGIPDWYTNTDVSDDWKGLSGQSLMLQYGSGQGASTPINGQNTQTSQQPGMSQGQSTGQVDPYQMSYMPSFVGQSLSYGANGSYAPDYAAASGLSPQSLNGYSSYGGYGASQSKQSSPYQPYVPTGYGQY